MLAPLPLLFWLVQRVSGLSTRQPLLFPQALLFLFSILRKVAWDYGRLALVTDADR